MNEITDWFSDPAHSAFSAFVVSLAAIVFSFIAWLKSRQIEKKQLEIEEAREKDRLTEKQKAYLTAKIVSEPLPSLDGRRQTTRHLLRIDNTGLAQARNIKVLLDGKSLLEHPAILKGNGEVTKIGPRSFIQYLLVLCDEVYPPFDLEVTWSDDSGGEPGFYQTTLTL
jgi:hypothetical protein